MHGKISQCGLVAIVKTPLINVDNHWALMPHYLLAVSFGYFSDPLFVSVCVVAVECCCLIFI